MATKFNTLLKQLILISCLTLVYSSYADDTIYESVNGKAVPKQFASVVRLLNKDNDIAESITATLPKCSYSKSQIQAFRNWFIKYPELKTISYDCQTAMIDKLRTSESISQLIGAINNPYGVRDDILYEIVQIVPESQPELLHAAIKGAYYENLSDFSNLDSDKLLYSRKVSLTMLCMAIFDKSGYVIPNKINQMISKKTYDTPKRSKYMKNLSGTVFAWQILGYSNGDEAKRCKRGDY